MKRNYAETEWEKLALRMTVGFAKIIANAAAILEECSVDAGNVQLQIWRHAAKTIMEHARGAWKVAVETFDEARR